MILNSGNTTDIRNTYNKTMALDPDLVDQMNKLDAETRRQLKMYNEDIQRILLKHMRGSEFVNKEEMFLKLTRAALLFTSGFATNLLVRNIIAGKKAVSNDNKSIIRRLVEAGANIKKVHAYFDNNEEQHGKFLEDTFLYRNFPGTKINVSRRIKTVGDGSYKVVRNIIELGIRDGQSSWEIAKEIEQYVIPNQNNKRVAPWTISRRKFNKPISYVPKGIPAGSVEYNAFRIARSELAATYQQAPYITNHGKWYVEGFRWVLSRSHPETDTCDDYAAHDEGIGIGIWRKIPKLPHPHCLCHTQTKTIPNQEMVEWLNRLNWN